MGAPDILVHLAAVGVRLSRHGDKLIAAPKEAVTPGVIELIRTHKPELLAALEDPDTPSDPAAEARRQRVLEKLEADLGPRYAVLTDAQTDPEAVVLALAIRGMVTCELRIPKAKYDGVLLLDLMERHGATVH